MEVVHGPSRPSSQAWSNPRLERPPRPPSRDQWAWASAYRTPRSLSSTHAPLISSFGTYICSEGPPTSTLALSFGPHHDRQIRRPERVTSSFPYRFLFLLGLRAFWNLPFLPFIRITDAVLVHHRHPIPYTLSRGSHQERRGQPHDKTISHRRRARLCISTILEVLEIGTSSRSKRSRRPSTLFR